MEELESYMGIENVTKHEKIFLDQQVRKAKKELLRKRKLELLIPHSAWESIPTYCEVSSVDIGEQKLIVVDEYNTEKVWEIEDFIEKHSVWGGV